MRAWVCHLCDELSRNGRVQIVLACIGSLNGSNQVCARGVFEQITDCAGADRVQHPLFRFISRQCQDPYGWKFIVNLASGFDPIDNGHIQIHQDDIRLQFTDHFHGLGAIGCRADYLNALRRAENGGQAFPDHLLIIANQNSDHDPISVMSACRVSLVPRCRSLKTSNFAPTISARSRSPLSPKCSPFTWSRSKPFPSSVMVRVNSPEVCCNSTRT